MLPRHDVLDVERPSEFDVIRQTAVFAPVFRPVPAAGVLATSVRFSADKERDTGFEPATSTLAKTPKYPKRAI